MLGTILSALASAFGIVSSLLRRNQQKADQQTGVQAQQLADTTLVNKEAQNAQIVDQDVEHDNRSALIDELSGGTGDGASSGN